MPEDFRPRVQKARGRNVVRNVTFARETCFLLDLLAEECQTSAGAIVNQALAPYVATLKNRIKKAGTFEAAFAEWEFQRDRAST